MKIWRAEWAAFTNQALEAAGQPALVDHRSYKRRGMDKSPLSIWASGQPDGDVRYQNRQRGSQPPDCRR
ncbi:MobA/MobL family protein [Lientehia hominis]|uniref:MobA/MobL family protein n=1 Tax=Lientehia hominis TaxID=2897778 RepID=UPI002FE6D850